MAKFTDVSFQNYRSFVDETSICLRPLTLLFGYNSTGKSALLRGIPLLAASLTSQSESPLDLDSAPARGSSFKDILTGAPLNVSSWVQIRASFEINSPVSVAWRILDLPERHRQIVERFRVTTDDLEIDALFDADGEGSKDNPEYIISARGQKFTGIPLNFRGLLPMLNDQQSIEVLRPAFVADGVIQTLLDLPALKQIASGVQWLSSVRSLPPRLNPYRGYSPTRLAPDGGGAVDVLAYDALANSDILSEVSSWYEKHLGLQLLVLPEGDYFRIALSPKTGSAVRVNIADVGEGLVQVLPVLVAAAMLRNSESRGILAVEEPESHLHPRLHGALAERFCEIAQRPESPNIVIETHSENILLRVQIAIADRQLDPEDVGLYWIRSFSDGRSRAEQVHFNSLGQPTGNWPPGVFKEDIEQGRHLIGLQRGRQG